MTETMDEIAEYMRSTRIGARTQANYRGKLNTIKLFLIDKNYENLIDHDGSIQVPLSDQVVQQLFGWLSVNTDLPKQARRRGRQLGPAIEESEEDDDNDDDEEPDIPEPPRDVFAENQVTISKSCMQGYKSALSWWYAEKNVAMSPTLEKWIAAFIHGYKKTIADKKQRGIMSIHEGRSKLSFPGYNAICEHLMKLTPEGRRHTWAQGIFGWAFMTLCWNLMARGESTRTVMLQHVDWKNDCMTVTFAKHKGDHTGEEPVWCTRR